VAAQARQWRPANEVEAALLRASNDGDQRAYFRILCEAPLYLPASAEAQHRGSPILYSWDATVDSAGMGGGRIVPVYTSIEALADAASEVADAYAVTTYPELRANWPDPAWKLAVDPHLSIGVCADIDDIARAARGEITVASAAEVMAAAAGDLAPANTVEEGLRTARLAGDVLAYIAALCPADVLVPVARDVAVEVGDPDAAIAATDFPWAPLRGSEEYHAVFTSPARLAEGWPEGGPVVSVPFMSVAQFWPGADHTLVVNAGTPLELILDGESVRELVGAVYAELTGQPRRPVDEAPPVVTLQKVLAPGEADGYLRDGRRHVTGFVYPAEPLNRYTTPAALYGALGLLHLGSPFRPDDAEAHVLRWPAHCPELYRLALGGPDEPTRRANGGWMVEPAPFLGTGVAAGDDPVPQLTVDSVALPHGAVLLRLTRTGRETVVATFDADLAAWLPVVPTDVRSIMVTP
jgi:hypothetical protein